MKKGAQCGEDAFLRFRHGRPKKCARGVFVPSAAELTGNLCDVVVFTAAKIEPDPIFDFREEAGDIHA